MGGDLPREGGAPKSDRLPVDEQSHRDADPADLRAGAQPDLAGQRARRGRPGEAAPDAARPLPGADLDRAGLAARGADHEDVAAPCEGRGGEQGKGLDAWRRSAAAAGQLGRQLLPERLPERVGAGTGTAAGVGAGAGVGVERGGVGVGAGGGRRCRHRRRLRIDPDRDLALGAGARRPDRDAATGRRRRRRRIEPDGS